MVADSSYDGKTLVFMVVVSQMMIKIWFLWWQFLYDDQHSVLEGSSSMIVIFWVYALHTECSFSDVSMECTVSTFRVTDPMSVAAELTQRMKYIGWIGRLQGVWPILLQVVRLGWRAVPNQWKPEKGDVLGNLTPNGSEHYYSLPSPTLTLIGQTSSNRPSHLTHFLPFCYLSIQMKQFCTLKMEAVHCSEALGHLNFTAKPLFK
jgi:hypothetical protein